MCEFAAERMYGVFQLNLYRGPPCGDCGLIDARSPVLRWYRTIPPFWLSAYTWSGSFGSTRHTYPSPPLSEITSSLIGPPPRRLMLGSPQHPLSCSPPYTQYGFLLHTATW